MLAEVGCRDLFLAARALSIVLRSAEPAIGVLLVNDGSLVSSLRAGVFELVVKDYSAT